MSKARIAIVIVTAAAIVRLVFAALLPPFPDETYYWAWSRHLAAGYFDHPPVVAWLIRFGDVLLAPMRASPSAFSIRLGPVGLLIQRANCNGPNNAIDRRSRLRLKSSHCCLGMRAENSIRTFNPDIESQKEE